MTEALHNSVTSEASPCRSWHDVNWRHAHRTVKRLQARIAKATNDGRWREVKKLQHLLVTSFAARCLAVKRITENTGKRTPGVDGVLWSTPTDKFAAVKMLSYKGYRPQPLKRVYIPKKNGKLRPLGIPTMLDRAAQALHALALDPCAETTADPHSYAFRRFRSVHDAIRYTHVVLGRPHRAEWVLEGDITSCFDQIDHQWLLQHVPMDHRILRRWLKAGYIDQGALHPTEAGTPQGGVISPILANLVLDGLEKRLREHFPRTRQYQAKVNLVRYADDFVVTGATRELLEQEVKPLIQAFLSERGLELSPEKTKITAVTNGFDFLGFEVRKFKDMLIIRPSRSAIARLKARLSEVLHEHRADRPDVLTHALNPVLRGWAAYYRHVASRAVFDSLDWWLTQQLWSWAKRRHPNKATHWVKRKYFMNDRGSSWIFFGGEGEGLVTIYGLRFVRIQRHLLVRSGANPYQPEDFAYLTLRQSGQTKRFLKGNTRALYEAQEGCCPHCKEHLAPESPWRVHRGNRGLQGYPLLVHENCLRQIQTCESVKSRVP